MYICYVEESRPPLWSSGQSSWLQISFRNSGFRTHYSVKWPTVLFVYKPICVVVPFP
jgi:hypothetical protein